jgi:hypothetical protein
MTRIRMLALAGAAVLTLASPAAAQPLPSPEGRMFLQLSDDQIRALLLSRQPGLSRSEQAELRTLDPDLWRKWLEQDQARRERQNQNI